MPAPTSRRDDLVPIPVTVLGGYLGAGKTTLLNRMLRSAAAERLAVLVNDFGDIAIDAELIESRDGDTIRLANGCICCSLANGFAEAMATIGGLGDRPHRLVIEASGVADPAAVAQWAHLPGFTLDGVVVLADAETVQERADDRLVGRHIRQQVVAGDVIIVNKTDLVDDAAVAEVHAWLAEEAPGRAVVDAVHAQVPLDLVLGLPPSGRREASAATDPGHRSWTLTARRPLDRTELGAALDALPSTVVRAKGIIDLADDPHRRWLVQRVGHRRTTTPHGPAQPGEPGRLVLIGLPDPAADAAVERLRANLFPEPEDPTP